MVGDLLNELVSEVSKRRVLYLMWLGINRPEVLSHVGDDSLAEVVAILSSGDWRTKAYATLVLGMMASMGVELPKYVVSEVLRLLSDPSEYVRSGAAWVLGRAGTSVKDSEEYCRAIYDSLIKLLSDTSWIVRTAAVKSLSELHRDCDLLHEVVRERLYAVLIGDRNAIVRRVAYEALKSYG